MRPEEDSRLACSAAGFEKLGVNKEGDWARTDRTGPILPLADLSPSETMSSDNRQRFLLDLSESYVEWVGWSFYISFSRDTGVSLFNVMRHGETILYELGLQEALAHYAGTRWFKNSHRSLLTP